METKKIFKVRKKGEEGFMALGHNNKTWWSVYPSMVIKYNPYITQNKDDFEVVVFEYELKETSVMKLK